MNVKSSIAVLLVVVVAFGCLDAASILECPPHSTFNGCMTRCPVTCQNIAHPPSNCISACSIGCECLEGFVKVNKGPTSQCVKSYECPMYSPKQQTMPYPVLRKLAAAASVPSAVTLNLTTLVPSTGGHSRLAQTSSTIAVLRKVKHSRPEENEAPEMK